MVIAEPKPKPPACESCGQVIDTDEDYLRDGICPKHRSWGHTLGYHGIVQLIQYLEAKA